MTRQLNVFMMPDDIAELDLLIQQMGLMILDYKMPEKKVQAIGSLADGSLSKKLIMHPSDEALVVFEALANRGEYMIVSTESPVIEFFRPMIHVGDKILNPARLIYTDDYLSEDSNEVLPKPHDFTTMAEKLFKAFKHHFKPAKQGTWLITKRAADWRAAGNGRFVAAGKTI